MDWSLVLVSQAIDCTIVQDSDSGRWGLAVERAEVSRACSNLRQYLRENRRWLLRPAVTLRELRFGFSALVWCAVLAAIHWLTTGRAPWLVTAGEMQGTFWSGEWWRLFTAVTLHADAAHLATNLVTGLVILGLACARFGAPVALLAGWITGAAGNLLGAMLYEPGVHGLGASGMVLGALGLLTTQALGDWKRDPTAPRRLVGSLAGGVMLFLLLGSSPHSDVMAHLGGFLAGMIVGTILSLIPAGVLRRRSVRLGAGVAVVVLFCAAWAKALQSAH
jgi:membrane associated rhomboid family serine protease